MTLFYQVMIRKSQMKNYTNRTKVEEWSKLVKYRRLSWLGHLIRLPDESPAKKALQEYIKPIKRKIGRPKTTWLHQIYNDLKGNIEDVNFKNEYSMIKDLENLCKNRKKVEHNN